MSSILETLRTVDIDIGHLRSLLLSPAGLAVSAICLTVGATAVFVSHRRTNAFLVKFISRSTPMVHKAVKPQKMIIQDRLEELQASRGELAICEIGSGIGNNMGILPEGSRLTVVEPLAEIRPLFDKSFRETGIERKLVLDDYVTCRGESIPALRDNAFDVVLLTYTLCSVSDVRKVLQESFRLLKPGGLLITMDHTRSSSSAITVLQIVIDTFWKYITGNCHLRRYTPDVLKSMNFSHQNIMDFEVKNLFPLVRSQVLCFATK